MHSFYRSTRAEISLDALRHNIAAFQKALPGGIRIMAVVKANAYGHGAVEIAQEAVACGADYLGVAFLDEAMELRKAGIAAPLLVLGYTPPEGIALALQHDITLTIFSRELLDALALSDQSERALKVHIKLDSGMGRLGLHQEDEAIPFIYRALQLPGVTVEGLYTHYACADEADKGYTYEQYRRFDRVVRHFDEQGICFTHVHAGNSATAFDLPELTYNMVRLGISMYGLYPSEEVNRQRIELQPLLSLKTTAVIVKTLPPGSAVSYGATYRTKGEEQIATLPVGYADGYTRMLSGHAEVLIHGRRVPVVGRICMDQTMINVTDVLGVKSHDEVVLIGRQGNELILADELARILGTINYEITCMISHRVPRVYYSQGKVIKTVNPLC